MNSNFIELPEEYQMALAKSRQDLVSFQIATNQRYSPNWHHEQIAKELEAIERDGDKDFKILVVSVPPRHGKSQQCSIDFPAWYLGKRPEKEIITASYSGELAQEFGGKTREKVASPIYKAIFPNVQLREDEKARSRWKTKQGGGYVAVGVGGAITGRGADILLIDDPVKNREEAESEVYREKIWNWFTSTAYTRLEPGGVVIVIMTRWHLDDLVGRILSNKDFLRRTKVINFPAISTFPQLPFRGANEPLWGDRFPMEELLDIKGSLGPYDWNCLYQGSPILTEKQEFHPDWMRRISSQVVDLMSCRRYLTIDTAMSKRSTADYTGFCDNRVNSQNFWHIQAWRTRIGPEELVNMLFTLQEKNNYEKIGIEKTAYTWGLKPFLDEEMRKRNRFLPIYELDHQLHSKEVRVRGLIPRYASGSIFHVDGYCKDLEEELATFPLGAHDDVVDSLAYQLQIAENNTRIESPIIEENIDPHSIF